MRLFEIIDLKKIQRQSQNRFTRKVLNVTLFLGKKMTDFQCWSTMVECFANVNIRFECVNERNEVKLTSV